MEASKTGSLPVPLTMFFGRQAELTEIRKRLFSSRLLTLIGPGGCGKTRLALEAGRSLTGEYQDGVWLVDFSQINELRLVPEVTAQALGIIRKSDRAIENVLIDFLNSRHILLIFDNCEHVAEAVAKLSQAVLTGAPSVSILATSQAPLGMPGETEWLVPSLPLPVAHEEPDHLDEILNYAAVQLFADRAALVMPDFRVTGENARAVLDICRRLDGIPLAIELAAARVKLLSVEEIATRLDDRFSLLTGGKPLSGSRHQTLQAAIDWSFALLGPNEQELLLRLSIFSGVWTIEAVEGVCAFDNIHAEDILELTGCLVDRSLVVVHHQEGHNTRYCLLETIRLYGLARLSSAAFEKLRDRHLDWYMHLAERADLDVHGPNQATAFDRLEVELPNLRTALDWACRCSAPDPRLLAGLRLAGAASWSWRARGYISDCISWSERLLALAVDVNEPEWAAARAYLHYGMGRVIWLVSHIDRSRYHLQASARLWSSLGEPGKAGYARAVNYLGQNLPMTDRVTIKALYNDAKALFEELGDGWGLAENAFHRGMLTEADSDPVGAERYYRQAIEQFQRVGDRQCYALVELTMARLLAPLGRLDEAMEALNISMHCVQGIGFQHIIGNIVFEQANIQLYKGELLAAETHYRQSIPYAEKNGIIANAIYPLMKIALIRLTQNQPDLAAELLYQANTRLEAMGQGFSRDEVAALILYTLSACVAVTNPAQAARLSGKSQDIFQRIGFKREDFALETRVIEPCLDRARISLGKAQFTSEQTEGMAMEIEELLSYQTTAEAERLFQKRSLTILQEEKARFAGLTAREREVAAWVARGLSNAAIARQMILSERTVSTHITNIFGKLGCSSRSQVAAWAVEKGLLHQE